MWRLAYRLPLYPVRKRRPTTPAAEQLTLFVEAVG
jgi:hypothetical protein